MYLLKDSPNFTNLCPENNFFLKKKVLEKVAKTAKLG